MYTYNYPHPAVTTDIVIFGFDGKSINILLIERGLEPYKGSWALPGGFLRMDETVEEGAKRELREETNIEDVGGRIDELKRAAPKNFAYNNEIMGVLVQALRCIREKNITDEIMAKIPAILADVERDRRFDADLKLAPAWIEKLILERIKR